MVAVAKSPPLIDARPSAPRKGRWVIAAGVPTILTGVHSAYYGQWIVDDAGLSFAYARSLSTGAGPVLQPGAEPVEGYSNPAWVAVLVVGRWLGLFDRGTWFGTSDLVLYPKLVALICCFGLFAAMFTIATTVTRRPMLATIVAGAATSAVPSFAIWTTSGLENALFALVVTVIAAALVRGAVHERLLTTKLAAAVGGLAALAALTRPDGIIYAVAYPLAAMLTVRSRATIRPAVHLSVLSVGAFAVPVVVYVSWRLVTFDDYLPNTARAKEQGLPTLHDLGRPAELVGYVGWLTAFLGVAAVAVVLSRPSRTRTAVTFLLVPLGLSAVSFVILRPDWMAQYRFATALWPLVAIIVTVSVAEVMRDASTRARLAAGTLAVVAATSSAAGFWLSERAFRAEPTVGVCNVAQNTGHLFNGYADILRVREGTLLAVDGGGTSLSSRLRFIDLSGLADRRVARFWQENDMPGLRDHIFDDVRPTFVKMFSGWAERERLALESDPRLARDYVLLHSGQTGSGEWVRREKVPDLETLEVANRWGRDVWILVTDRYRRVVPPLWWCGDTLRPTPFRDGAPASSPLTAR